jgi:hypothetical protein
MNTQRFRKIKYDGDTVELTWATQHNADVIAHTMTSPGRPRDAFPGTMQAFVPTVLTLLEMPEDYRVGLRIRGLSIKAGRDGEGRMLVLTCQKQLDESDSPYIFNTPLIKEADKGPVGKLLDQAEQEATQFLRGERIELSFLTDVEAADRERAQAGAVFDVSTGPPLTDVQIRDGVRGIGYALTLSDIRGLSNIERDAAIAWLGTMVAANFGAALIPEHPECLADSLMSTEREESLLEVGPCFVQESGSGENVEFQVVHRDTREVPGTFVDFYDAQVSAARLNRATMLAGAMTSDEVAHWTSVGPWIRDDDESTVIHAGTQSEKCDSVGDAVQRAARYNRTIGERSTDDSRDLWETEPAPKLSDDAVQEIKAATEAGEGEAETPEPTPSKRRRRATVQ